MKKTTFVIAITLCGAGLFAADLKTATPRPVVFQEATQEPGALTKIFSNLGPATSAYTAAGYYVAGPTSALGTSQFLGLPFKPAKNSTAEQLQAAISWNSSGANQVNLSLYSDNAGVPGTLLAGPVTVTNLPAFGTCCRVAKATIPATSLVAGTQYWIVADTPASGTGSDSEDVWDAVHQTNIAADVGGGGWSGFPANLIPAGAVYGTIP